jgi:plasmid stabilization system protein ParE
MTALRIVFGPDAEDDVKRIDEWWREHRRAAPNLFVDELEHALSLIAAVPYVGKAHQHRSIPRLRRLLLRRSRYHVYYVFTSRIVVVVAVWGAVRGVTPGFRARRKRLGLSDES